MNKLSLLVVILAASVGQAQIVNIPDVNFKNALLSANANVQIAKDNNDNNVAIDINGDGEIQFTEAEAISFLNVSGKEIDDLTGIAAFTSIHTLYCSSNNIAILDVSALNENLTFLQCSWNNLTFFDASQNTNLNSFAISGNQLTEIDVTTNVNLTYFSCGHNELSYVDVSQNINLNRFHVASSPYLTQINLQNGNNANFDFPAFLSYYNNIPNLEVVYVDELDSYLTNFIEDEVGHPVCFLTDLTLTNCDAVGVEENSAISFVLYPNPAVDLIQVSTENNIDLIEIYSELGQLVMQANKDTQLDVQHLVTGIYILKAIDVQGNSFTKKFFKK